MAASAVGRSTDVISVGFDGVKSSMNDQVQFCAECATVAASCRCIKCECFMCFACFEEVHKVSKYMRKHQYEPLANTDTSKSCREHVDRPIEYFCLEDERAICAHCVVMGSHKGHTVCLMEERKQKLLEAIAPLSSMAKDALGNIRKTLDLIDTLISKSHSQEDSVVLDLREHFKKVHILLKSRQEMLEQEFRRACTDKQKALNNIHSDISSRKKHLEEAMTDLSRLEVNSVIENGLLLEKLQNVVAYDCVIPSSLLNHVEMDLNAGNLTDYIMRYGKVVGNDNIIAASKTVSVKRLDAGDCQSKLEVVALPEEGKVCEPHSPPKLHRITNLPHSPPCLRRITDLPSSVTCSLSNVEFQNSEVESVKSFGAPVASNGVSVFSSMPVKMESPVCNSVPIKLENSKMENSSLGQSSITPMSSAAAVPSFGSNSSEEPLHSVPSSNSQSVIDESCSASYTTFNTVPPTHASLDRLYQLPSAQDLSSLSWRQGLKNSTSLECAEPSYQSSASFGFSNRMEPVVISHIHHPGFFWVHFTKDLEQLTRLSHSIQDYCNGSHPVNDNLRKQFAVGDMVLAKFHDGTWYRAQVIAKHDSGAEDTVEVRFIDYGNTDTVALDKVQTIRPFFLKVPQLVSSCCLADIVSSRNDSWSSEAVESFARMTSNLPLMMKVVEQNSPLKVRLSWPLGDGIRDEQMMFVSDALVFLEHAAYSSVDCKLPNIDKKVASKYIRPIPPPKDIAIPVTITNVKSPHEFCIQVHEKDALYFTEMMKDIERTCTADRHNGLGLFLPFVGNPCLANFGTENQPHWCRAEVVELLGKGLVRVRNIDFGGEKEVSIFHLKKLMDKFQVIPVQAVACCLADVEPVPGRSWDAAASELLEGLCSKPLFMRVKDFSVDHVPLVYLSTDAGFPSEYLINFMLVSSDLAVASRTHAKKSREVPEKCSTVPSKLISSEKSICTSPKLNSSASPSKEQVTSVTNLPAVIISHFVSPDEFYIQVAASKNMKRLETLMQGLNAEYANSKPIVNAAWKCEDECVARYSKDKRLYRAKITAIIGDRVEVLCRDYGYSDIISTKDLHPVLQQFMSTAWFSTRCHLVDVKPSGRAGGWPESTCEALKKMICQKMCHISIKGPVVGVSLPVDVVVTKTVKGSALMPDSEIYISITYWLLDQQLSLPINCPETKPGPTCEHNYSDVESRSSEFTEDDEDQGIPRGIHSTNHSGEQKSSGRSVVDFLAPEEPSANKFVFAVTFVDLDCCIYGQEGKGKADLRPLSDLVDRVQKHYRNTMPESNNTVWTLGQPVAAQFLEDDQFYRAKLVRFHDNGIEVQYVDYGNTEVLSKERLRILDESFMVLPIQCLSYHLFQIRPAASDNRWSEEAIGAIDEIVNNKVCQLTIREKDTSHSKPFVDLTLPTGEDLGSVLCDKGLALRGYNATVKTPSSRESHSPPMICNGNGRSSLSVRLKRLLPERSVASPYSQMTLPARGDILQVIVTEIDHPNAVYVQHFPLEHPDMAMKQINLDLDQLVHLSSVYSSDVPSYRSLTENELVPGTPCVARYSADDCWYRAEIICTAEVRGCMEVGLRFIDYGSSDFVSVDRLRAIPTKHLNLPAQCRRCQLYGVELLSENESYLADVMKKLTELITHRVLAAVVRSVSPEGTLLVDFFDRDLYLEIGSACPCLFQELIDDGLLDFANNNIEIESGEEEEEEEEGSVSMRLQSVTD